MSQEGPPPGQGIPMATAAGSIHQQQAAAAAQLSPTLFSRAKLYEIVNSISYGERLEPSVEYVSLLYGFIDNLLTTPPLLWGDI